MADRYTTAEDLVREMESEGCLCTVHVDAFGSFAGGIRNPACPAHKTRELRDIAKAMIPCAEIVSVYGERTAPETKARIVQLCRDMLAGLGEGADGSR